MAGAPGERGVLIVRSTGIIRLFVHPSQIINLIDLIPHLQRHTSIEDIIHNVH